MLCVNLVKSQSLFRSKRVLLAVILPAEGICVSQALCQGFGCQMIWIFEGKTFPLTTTFHIFAVLMATLHNLPLGSEGQH